MANDRPPFVTMEEFQAIRGDDVNKAFSTLETVLERVHQITLQRALMAYPDAAINTFRRAVEMQRVRDEFLEKHPDIPRHFDVFSEELAKVEEADPAARYEDMLSTAAERTRMAVSGIGNSDKVPRPGRDQVDQHFAGVMRDEKS